MFQGKYSGTPTAVSQTFACIFVRFHFCEPGHAKCQRLFFVEFCFTEVWQEHSEWLRGPRGWKMAFQALESTVLLGFEVCCVLNARARVEVDSNSEAKLLDFG